MITAASNWPPTSGCRRRPPSRPRSSRRRWSRAWWSPVRARARPRPWPPGWSIWSRPVRSAGAGAGSDLHPQGCGGARVNGSAAGCECSARLRAGPAAAVAAGRGSRGDPEVATYHSFGGRLIADFGPLAGVEPAARVLTPTGAWQLARRVVGRWDGDLHTDLGPDQVTERLLAISGALADHLTDVDAAVRRARRRCWTGCGPHRRRPRQRGALHSALADHVKRLQDRQWILPLVQAFARGQAGAAGSSTSPTRCRSPRPWSAAIRGSGPRCGTSTGWCCSTSTRTPVTPSG